MSFSPWLPRAVLKQKCRSLAKSGANPEQTTSRISSAKSAAHFTSGKTYLLPFVGSVQELGLGTSSHSRAWQQSWCESPQSTNQKTEICSNMWNSHWEWHGKDGRAERTWNDSVLKSAVFGRSRLSHLCVQPPSTSRCSGLFVGEFLCCSRALGGFRHSQTHLCLLAACSTKLDTSAAWYEHACAHSSQLILRQAPFLYILQNFTLNVLHVRSLTWTEQLVASAPLAHWQVGNKMDKTEQRSHMQTGWHNKCTGWHGWSWQLPKQAWPGNVHQFTIFLLSISRSQGFSRDSNVKVTIIQRAFCFHCYLHLIMHPLSLSDCFLVLFCFQARGSPGGYAKTPWQASMATQKAWDFCRMHLNALNALNTDRRSRLKSIVKEVLRTVNRPTVGSTVSTLCRLSTSKLSLSRSLWAPGCEDLARTLRNPGPALLETNFRHRIVTVTR